jgi:hypothetical protein
MDFAAFCATREIAVNQENANVSAGEAPDGGYRHVHKLDRASIEKVNALFADDFTLLGYDRL